MMKKLLMVIIPALLTGCNIALIVPMERVIQKQTGYMVIAANNQYVDFVPAKIDTSLSLSQNLATYSLGKAFYLNGLFPRQVNYLKIYGDTLSNSSILIPIELKYTETKEVNRELRKQEKKYQEHYIKVDNKIYSYKITLRDVHYIGAHPVLSAEKKRQKAKSQE